MSSFISTFSNGQPFSGKKEFLPSAFSTNFSCLFKPSKPLYQSWLPGIKNVLPGNFLPISVWTFNLCSANL